MFELLACPPATSIQDLGRPGYRRFGVPLSGALDTLALRLVNALVGNPPGAAALEMRLPGLRLRALLPLRIALAQALGTIVPADDSPRPLSAWRSATLAAGEELQITRLGGGVAYLALGGGIDVPKVLGSRSSYPRAALGVSLRDCFTLAVGQTDLAGPERAVSPEPIFEQGPIRVLPGPQREKFTEAAWETLLTAEFRVTSEADRMGMRLEGPRLAHVAGADILSEAVTPGVIQVPGDGRPIVLLADAQTIGGYAKIATVIRADLPRLGRLSPGETIRFEAVDLATAQAALWSQEARLAEAIADIAAVCAIGEIDTAALYASNLVDGVIHAQ